MAESRLREIVLVAVASVSAFALAGCGSGDGDAGGGVMQSAAFSEAAAATRATDSMRFTMSGEMTVAGQGGAFEAEGVTDNRAKRTSMTTTAPDPSGGASELEMKIVMDGATMYMSVSGEPRWFAFDLGKAAGGEFASLFELGSQNDPLQVLEYLRASGSVEVVGEEQVRGVRTTRHRGELDYAVYADLVEDENPAAAEKIRELVEEAGGTLVVPIEVWIDDDNRVRREAVDYSQPNLSTRVTMDFFDFGVDVDIDVPAGSDVVDLTDVLKEGGG